MKFYYYYLSILFLVSGIFLYAPLAKATDLFYNQPSSDSQTFFGRSTGIYYMGLTFPNPAKYDICEIKMKVSRGGSGHSDGVYLNLYQTSSDSVPNSGTLIASTNVVSAGSLPGGHTFVSFTFPSGICYALQSGVRYGVTVNRTGGMSDTAYYILYSQYSSGVTQWYGSYRTAWVRLDGSSTFLKASIQTYGTTGPPPPEFDDLAEWSFTGQYEVPYSASYGQPIRAYSVGTNSYALHPASVVTSTARLIPNVVLYNNSTSTQSWVIESSPYSNFSSSITTSTQTVSADKFLIFGLPNLLYPDNYVYVRSYLWITTDEGSELYGFDPVTLQYKNSIYGGSNLPLPNPDYTVSTSSSSPFYSALNSLNSGFIAPFSEKMPVCFVSNFLTSMTNNSVNGELSITYTLAGFDFTLDNVFDNEIFDTIAFWSQLLFSVTITFAFFWLGIKTIENIQL